MKNQIARPSEKNAAMQPSREEIEAALAEIHAKWSARRRRNRHAMAEFQVRYRLTPIVTGSRR